MGTLIDIIRAQAVRALVQHAITCPLTGTVLDIRTCVILNDHDGDPCAVLSPEGWGLIESSPVKVAALGARGITKAETH